MASTKTPTLKVILGAAPIGDKDIGTLARFHTPDEIAAYLDAYAKRGYNELDTAQLYGNSESRLGSVEAGKRFLIDTKVKSWEPKSHTKENVLRDIDQSLEKLRIPQINLEYLHVPDRTTPFQEACEAMDEAHKAGKIKSWGLSNYKAEEVQEIVDICEQHGYVKPSVYQGHYNALVRGGEKALFPTLRKHGMAFYAYSPAAGGFFAGNFKEVQKRGRWDTKTMVGELYAAAYLKPSIITAAEKALQVATEHGVGGHAMALRWTMHHGILDAAYGDGVIIGASSLGQLDANLDAVEAGPLPDEVVSALEALYEEIGDDQAAYHL